MSNETYTKEELELRDANWSSKKTLSTQKPGWTNELLSTPFPEKLPKRKSVHDLVAETCPKKEDGSYDVSNFDFNKAYKELGLTKVV